MSASRSFRCLFAKPASPSRCLRRSFHPSSSLNKRSKPKFPSVKSPSLEASKSKLSRVKKAYPPYTKADEKVLAENYTPAQMTAIKAGEAAIDLNDIAEKAAFREDSMGLNYLDDLSEIRPVVDKPVRAPESNYDPNLRFKEEDEFVDDIANWVQNAPENPSGEDWNNFYDNLRLTVGKEEAELNSPSSEAPEIPPVYKERFSQGENDESAEITPAMRRVMLQTGYSAAEIKRFRVKLLLQRRVVNQTKLGKIESLHYVSVAGNGKGMLGIGEAKTSETQEGRELSFLNAIRNMKAIPRYEDRTIFGDVKGKVGGTELVLMTRPPGMCLSQSSPPFYSCANN